MAASFKIGETVQVDAVVPTGPVLQLSVNQSGDIQYLVEWTDASGVTQETWFNEDDLKSV